MNRTTMIRLATAAVATSWVATCVSGPAMAAGDSGVDVVNTETVQVYFDASGKVDSKRVYEQIDLTGHGKVDLRNPVETKGLRNLDGFGGLDVVDGEQVVKTSVNGSRRLRSVSDYTGQLPLKVAVSYKLDGKSVKPGDVVGKSGKLEVIFEVENTTSQEQEVTYDDGKGGTVTKTVQVPLPIVGSLSTTAPPSFTNVQSGQANLAGDGEGGTQLSFTMTLFPPIGSTKATFGYTADITDGVVPEVDVSALPVNPLESPTFSSAAKSYQGGADTGTQLTAGASEIDSNLLKLHDGAADLLAGLIKLNSGADELSSGLSGTAVPGSQALADGASKLNQGIGQLDDGAGQLADGAGQLDDGARKLKKGAGDASDGSRKLTNGLKQIDGGLEQLADGTTGLPAAKDGITKLRAGVQLLLTGLGDVSNDKSLIGGLHKLATELGGAQTGASQIAGGLGQLTGSTGLPAARGGVDQVQGKLAAAAADGGSYDQLRAALTGYKPLCAAAQDPGTCNTTFQALIDSAAAGKQSAKDGSDALQQVSAGLGSALTALNGQLLPGAQALASGLGDAVDGAGDLEQGAKNVKAGVVQVNGGLDSLAAGVTKAVAGVFQLSSGADDAYNGSSDLSDGLQQLKSGAGDLSDGTGDLRAGAKKLANGADDASDGSSQVADGAQDLADGLGDAAVGSQQLADGLAKAADGAPQLVDGSQQLSTDGTKKLVSAGEDTAQSYGEMVAVIDAGAKRAQTEDMAYGAPDDALGLTAYSYVIQGDDGESSRNLARGIGAVAVLGAGAGIFALRRRFIA